MENTAPGTDARFDGGGGDGTVSICLGAARAAEAEKSAQNVKTQRKKFLLASSLLERFDDILQRDRAKSLEKMYTFVYVYVYVCVCVCMCVCVCVCVSWRVYSQPAEWRILRIRIHRVLRAGGRVHV